jgi:hypothetical protein
VAVRRWKRIGLQQAIDLSSVDPSSRGGFGKSERQHAIHFCVINDHEPEADQSAPW